MPLVSRTDTPTPLPEWWFGLKGEATPSRLACNPRHKGPKPEAPVLNDLGPDDGELVPAAPRDRRTTGRPGPRPALSLGARLRSWS